MFLPLLFVNCSSELPVRKEEITEIDQSIFGFDAEEKIILYNGTEAYDAEQRFSINGEAIVFSDLSKKTDLGQRQEVSLSGVFFKFYQTELPIVKIQTSNNQSVGEDYNSSQFVIIDSGKVVTSGNLGIRIRGNTSRSFPKKSYRLELWEDPEGITNRNASILGMRNDDDWLLDGMWNEPIAVRDKSAMELWLSFGRVHYRQEEPNVQLGADRRYCELFVNGAYRGLYYIGERLDRKQLKLEVVSEFVDGGELYKAQGWGDAVGGFSLPEVDNSSITWGGYEVKYPTEEGTFDWAKLKVFKSFILQQDINSFAMEYANHIDVENIIDYFIFTNLIYAFDNQGNNVFIGRRDQTSPYFFVSWDFDATLGLGITGAKLPVTETGRGMNQHILTSRLLKTDGFPDALKVRWGILRGDHLQSEKIKSFYRENYAQLLRNNVYEREALVVGLDRSLPDPTSLSDIERIIDERLSYLDEYISEL